MCIFLCSESPVKFYKLVLNSHRPNKNIYFPLISIFSLTFCVHRFFAVCPPSSPSQRYLLAHFLLSLLRQASFFIIHRDQVFSNRLNISCHTKDHCCAFSSLPDLSSHSPSKSAAGFSHRLFVFFLPPPFPFHFTNNHFHQTSTTLRVDELAVPKYWSPLNAF